MTIADSETLTFVCCGSLAVIGAEPQLHAEVLTILAEHNGTLIQHASVVVASFPEAAQGLAAVVAVQRQWLDQHGLQGLPLAWALNSGPRQQAGADQSLSRALDLLHAAHPGQVLLAESTWRLVSAELPGGVTVLELGVQRLKDLMRAEPIYQLDLAGSPADFPPLGTIDSVVNNLPVQQMPLIGRQAEIAELRELLQQPSVRLLTLRGTSGTGKTRLSLQVAAEELASFADGVYFVALAPVSDPTVVASAIAQVIGIKETGHQALVQSLIEHLATRRVLLLLDNFEQVLEAATLISALLAGTEQLKIMITSQIEVRLPAEHVFLLPPLALPDLKKLPALEELGQYPAVRLFVERTQAIQPTFELTEANAPAVAELCARLVGLPLAIELATAHSTTFTPQDMLLMLRSRLTLVKRTSKISSRAQILRHVLDWSYNLLGPSEQALFARLGTFVGGCTLEAVEAVCNADADLTIDVLDGVNLLLNKHLLLQEELAEGELRYIMLDALHEYAGKRLAERRERTRLRQQHAHYFLQVAEDAEPELRSAQQADWLNRLEGEHHNLRAALRWSLDQQQGEAALRLSGALSKFWLFHGHLSEGRRWLEATLESSDIAAPALRAKALNGLANLINIQGDYDQARHCYEESLALAQSINDVWMTVTVLVNLGIVLVFQGDLPGAQAYYEQSLVIWRELDDRWGIATTLNNLADVASELGDQAQARRLYEEGLLVLRELGDQRSIGIILLNLGVLDFEQGRYDEAHTRLEESLQLFRQLGDQLFTANTLHYAGQVAAARGDQASAHQMLFEALTAQHTLGNKRGIASSLEALGMVLAPAQAIRATQLLSSASNLRTTIGAPLPATERIQYDRTINVLRQELGPTAFEQVWITGQDVSLEQVVRSIQE